jgi:Zn-dependent protease with chaperone function
MKGLFEVSPYMGLRLCFRRLSMNTIHASWQDVRYGDEQAAQQWLLKSPQLVSYLDTKREKVRELERERGNLIDRMAKDYIELNPILTPHLYELYRGVCLKLDINLPVTIFIADKPELNAGIFKLDFHPDSTGSYVMIITKAALDKLDDNELEFLIGHELGHEVYNHNELVHIQELMSFSGDDDDDDDKNDKFGLPTFVEKTYLQWRIKREISCDRLGVLACSDVRVAIRALMKISSGIPAQYITDRIDDIVALIEKLCNKQVDIGEDFRTHPELPIRIISLDRFGSFLQGNGSIGILDRYISNLCIAASRYPQQKIDEAVMHLLAIGGMYIFRHKKFLTKNVMNMLVDTLYKNFTDYPEKIIISAVKRDRVEKIAYYNEIVSGNKRKCEFIVLTWCRFALSNGNLDEQEKSFIFAEAKALGVDHHVVSSFILAISEKEGLTVDNDILELLHVVNS